MDSQAETKSRVDEEQLPDRNTNNLALHSSFTPANVGSAHKEESKTPLFDLLALDKGQTKH